jgi:NAD+-processing family protein with receiver domain
MQTLYHSFPDFASTIFQRKSLTFRWFSGIIVVMESEKIRLWLDDIRVPDLFGYFGWHWAKTASDAIDCLRTGQVVQASLDHDLTPEQTMGNLYGQIRTDGQKSGYDVVLWLEQHPQFWPPEGVRVHSANPAGKARMEVVIKKHYGRNFR